ASALGRGEVPVAAEQDPGGVAPVLGESGLERAHDRALYPDVGLTPVLGLSPVARPLLSHSGSAREADLAVDHQDPAMVAMVDALDRERVERMVPGHLASRVLEPLPVLARHLTRAHRVEEHMDGHAGPA